MAHKSNKRITDYQPCEICHTNSASETHELSGGNANRNNSIEHGFQLKLCKRCHDNFHLYYSKELKNQIRANKQHEIMAEKGMSIEEWRDIFGKSWV